MTARYWLLLAALSLVSVQPTALRAQPDDSRTDAEQLFRAGEQAFNAGRYLAAARAFDEAYKLLPLPAIAFSTAQAYRLQYFIDKEPSHLLLAIELYRRYLAEVSDGGRRDDAADGLAELEILRESLERTGRMSVRQAPLSAKTQLMVTARVAGARARVDTGGAIQAGPTPLIIEVEPGSHEVTLEADGYFSVTQPATAVEGRLIVVEVELEAEPAEMIVTLNQSAAIVVDGRPIGRTPRTQPLALSAGPHFVAVTRRGHYAWTREIDLARGEAVELRPILEVTSQRRASYWLLGAGGLALSAAGISGTVAWLTDRELASLEDKRQRESLSSEEFVDYQQQKERRDSRLQVTYVALGIGAAAAVTGAVLFWFDTPRVAPTSGQLKPTQARGQASRRRASTDLWLVPTIEAEQAGIGIAGHF